MKLYITFIDRFSEATGYLYPQLLQRNISDNRVIGVAHIQQLNNYGLQ